jgi:voltage-gated potassium channel
VFAFRESFVNFSKKETMRWIRNKFSPGRKEHLNLRQIAILVLSLYVLGALFVQSLFQLSPTEVHLLNLIDTAICLFFLYDFSVRFHQAPSKLEFMKWGWIDLLSSIPMMGVLHWGRLVRVLEIIRILRAFRSSRVLLSYLFQNSTKTTLTTIALASSISVIFSSIAILSFEIAPDSNIKTPSDAIWWSFVTMTTVGYGDHYPVTTEGRLLAVMLMVVGIGLFGAFTGLVSSLLVEAGQKKEEKELQLVLKEVRLMREKMESLEKEVRMSRLPAKEASEREAEDLFQ